jgi:glycosyltransferase involved in cell wall biosynthesis
MSHVALVIPTLDAIGGAERQVVLLARGLRLRGWRVTVLALLGSGGETANSLVTADVGFLNLEMRRGLVNPLGWIRFHRWLRGESPDVVHAHLPHAAWLARWSRLGAPARALVDTLHSASTGTAGRRLGYRWSRWLPDRVSAVGNAVAEAHVSAGMIAADRLLVLPNGVDVEAWKPDAASRAALRKELGLTNEFLWLAAGRVSPVKDYPTLLAAFSQLPATARLVVAGSGPLDGELRQLATSLGLERRVRFLGFEPDLRRWMQAADGFVQSSLWEGLPMVLMEAAACALPSVATDVAGTGEVISDGQTGWLSAAGSAPDLAAKMVGLMDASSEERGAMGARARRQMIERFSLDAVLDRWEALYHDLLLQNPTPRRWARTD